MAKILVLSKDDYLLREGEESDEMYYLNRGLMTVYKRVGDSEKQIAIIKQGELVGEMLFLDGEARCASVKAAQDCELFVIPHSKIREIEKTLPNWYSKLVQTLLERLRKANSSVRI
ncbi:MAG: cyclic nucleotide-binding domain-containing protein [Halobacteriovoraceae bacterium]|nr:cyclic nucleotide-binding domain-containing protein [Halobacteriovoraceae bacterium]